MQEEDERMVKVKVKKHEFYLDGYLKSNLDALKKSLKQDYDAFILLTGREGFGKTTLSFQCALYCDQSFNLDRVCFTIEQFLEAVKDAERFQAIVFDETMGFLSSRQSMSKFNRALIKVMSEMRSKNLFVFLNIPSFFMMDWYVALHRTTGLLYINKRSCFASYDYRTKHKLYMEGKKYRSHSVPPNFTGRFTKYFPINKKDYEKKKQEAIKDWEDAKAIEKTLREQRNNLIIKIFNNGMMDLEGLSKTLDISEMQVRRILT